MLGGSAEPKASGNRASGCDTLLIAIKVGQPAVLMWHWNQHSLIYWSPAPFSPLTSSMLVEWVLAPLVGDLPGSALIKQIWTRSISVEVNLSLIIFVCCSDLTSTSLAGFSFFIPQLRGDNKVRQKKRQKQTKEIPFNGLWVCQLIFLQVPIDVAGRSGSFHDVSSYSVFFSGNGRRPENTILPSLFGRTEWKRATPEIPKESQC